jgi:hypothetical protein
MTIPASWVFAVVGSLLAVGSAIVAGIMTWLLERHEKKLERELADTKLDQSNRYAFEATMYYNFAQLKLWLAELIPKDRANALRQQAHFQVQQAVDYRNRAAGYPLKDHEIKGLVGENFGELAGKWDRLLESYVDENNRLVALKESLTERLADTRRWTAQSRWLSVSLQIIGLIIVMCKDLPRASH